MVGWSAGWLERGIVIRTLCIWTQNHFKRKHLIQLCERKYKATHTITKETLHDSDQSHINNMKYITSFNLNNTTKGALNFRIKQLGIECQIL